MSTHVRSSNQRAIILYSNKISLQPLQTENGPDLISGPEVIKLFSCSTRLTSPGVRDSRRLRDKTHSADNYNVQPKSGTTKTIDLFTCFSSGIAPSARFSPLAR